MARLTDTSYLATHLELRSVWLKNPVRFALLSAGEQWALHGYFAPEHRLTDDRLLAYRREVSKVDPSLPQRAGKALTKWRMKESPLAAYREHSHSPAPGAKRSRNYAVAVFSLVHPEIDPQKLARAFLAAFEDHEKATSRRRPRR
ncbi:hypothetical protein [Microbacterium sp. CFBP 8794]|uniref:hypothetical protein n=1 Tax=Microbacterium sp. CFBP 8794 TaxID=2775269 RepID=UPI001781DCEE|nr:hypothetical protein [Microbacterium sp. CFBP 8794]MBD8479284.1 hypothetical protein [Microbacterium sp. CFBP 8794]